MSDRDCDISFLPELLVDKLNALAMNKDGTYWLEAVGGPLMGRIEDEKALYAYALSISKTHPGLFGFAMSRAWDVANHPGPIDDTHPYLYRTDAEMNAQDAQVLERVSEINQEYLDHIDAKFEAYAQEFGQIFVGASRSQLENLVWRAPNDFSRGVCLGCLVLNYWREAVSRAS